MQADAFLFEALVEPGRRRRRGEADVRPHAARCASAAPTCGRSSSSPTASTSTALAKLLEGGLRPKLAHIIPNFQNPAGYTLSREKRDQLLALARRARLPRLRGRPVRRAALRGETLPTMLSLDEADHVVYASSFSKTVCPGIRVGYLVGPAELIARIAKLATNTYISPNMVAQSIVNEFVRGGRDRALDRDGQGRAARARATRLGDALQRELPEARFQPTEGGYFLWVELPGGHRRRRAVHRRRRARRRVRQGHGLPARGRREQPPPRLLRRDARADRRGRRAPRRGRARRDRRGPDGVGSPAPSAGMVLRRDLRGAGTFPAT